MEVVVIYEEEIFVECHFPVLSFCQTRVVEAFGEEEAEWEVEDVFLFEFVAFEEVEAEVVFGLDGDNTFTLIYLGGDGVAVLFGYLLEAEVPFGVAVVCQYVTVVPETYLV